MLCYRIISPICLVLGFIFYNYLPAEWGKENGSLEWLQAIILLLGAFICWWASASNKMDFKNKLFWFSAMTLFLILSARELSWGRVFFPSATKAHGQFVSLHDLWYGPAVYPLLTMILLCLTFVFIKYKLYNIPLNLIQDRLFPWTDFAVTVLSALVSYVAEKKLHLPIMEELAETIAYIGLIVLSLRVKHALSSYKSKSNNVNM